MVLCILKNFLAVTLKPSLSLRIIENVVHCARALLYIKCYYFAELFPPGLKASNLKILLDYR